jgi:N5-(carboxyethyl)ornithine synthase
MNLGFIRPNYPGEKRVALLPEHIRNFDNTIWIQREFGKYLDIRDENYESKGCRVVDKEQIYAHCDAVFNLKLTQPEDYHLLRENQMIIGWTHPTGSGAEFMASQAASKKLLIVDLDNIYPAVYSGNASFPITFLKPNFIWKNSYMAGFSSTLHALMNTGILPDSSTEVAILSCGNVAQGAYTAISKFNCNTRLFYRKTMSDFKEKLGDFDIIISGIELIDDESHILTLKEQEKLKDGCLIIDAAADAGGAIEGTEYTSVSEPVYNRNGVYYYEVNNSPTIFYRKSSFIISEVFSRLIYRNDVKVFFDVVNSSNKNTL